MGGVVKGSRRGVVKGWWKGKTYPTLMGVGYNFKCLKTALLILDLKTALLL